MPTKPTEPQLETLSQVLLDAFDHDSLSRLTTLQLDLPLEWVTPVAGKRDLITIVGTLIVHFAAQEGGLKRLLVAAQKESPDNPALKELMIDWFDIEFKPIDLTELIEQMATSIIGIDMADVEAAMIELEGIITQGDGDVTGVKLRSVKSDGEIRISNVQATGTGPKGDSTSDV